MDNGRNSPRRANPILLLRSRSPESVRFLIECSCKWMSSTMLLARGRSPEMADFTIRSVHDGSNSLPDRERRYRNSPLRYGFRRRVGSSIGNFSHSAVFAKLHQAALIAMLVSQVANRDLPSKSLRWTKAFRKHSCAASSASSRFRMIRRVTQETCFI